MALQMPPEVESWVKDCYEQLSDPEIPYFDAFPTSQLPLSSRNAIIGLIATYKEYTKDSSHVLRYNFYEIMQHLVEPLNMLNKKKKKPYVFSIGNESTKMDSYLEVHFESFDHFLMVWKRLYNIFKTVFNEFNFSSRRYRNLRSFFDRHSDCKLSAMNVCTDMTKKDKTMAYQLCYSILGEMEKVYMGCHYFFKLYDVSVSEEHMEFMHRLVSYLLRTDILHIGNEEGILMPLVKASFKCFKYSPKVKIPIAKWRPMALVFAMGTHERLGRGSVLRMLSPEIADYILKEF